MRGDYTDLVKSIKAKKTIPLEIRREVAQMRWNTTLTDADIARSINAKYHLDKVHQVRQYQVRIICIEFYGKYKTTTNRTTLVADKQPIGDTTPYRVLKYRCHPDVIQMLSEARIPHSDMINTILRWYKERVFDKEKVKQTMEDIRDRDTPRFFD